MFVCVAYLAFCVLSSLISVEMSGGWGGHFVYVIPYIQKKGVWGGGCVFEGGANWSLYCFFFLLSQGHYIQKKENPEA